MSIQDASEPWRLYLFVVLYGLGYGALGPVYAAATADLFPGKHLGTILGVREAGDGLGGACGALMVGYLYDRLGHYVISFRRRVRSWRSLLRQSVAGSTAEDTCHASMKRDYPRRRNLTVTTLIILTTLIMVLGLALEGVNGNGGGQGLAHALEVLKEGPRAEKLKALELLARLGDMQVMPALVQALRDDDERVRAAADNVMWAIWLRSGNDEIDALMAEGVRFMELQRYLEAVEIFDQIIARAPRFAEGYNKRATVYYLLQEFDKSIADIHRTLELNPVHFGALSGMGLCYLGLDQPRQALEWFERAIAVNPNMDTIQSYIQQLREFLNNQTF